MLRRLHLIFLAAIMLVCAHAAALAQASTDSLDWKPGYRLTWEDFQGIHKDITIFGAQTFTTLKYRLYKSDTGWHVVVRCVFLKKVSWNLDEFNTPYALQHEQDHFDITELYARKLRKEFRAYKYSRRTVNNDIAAIFKKVCAEKAAFNAQYDKETIHALDRSKQEEWDLCIAQLLNELNEYASN